MADYAAHSQASNGSGAGPSNIAAPSGTVSGSYLVAFQNADEGINANTLTLTGGTTWNVLASGTNNGNTYKVYWKLAGSSEPANYSYDWNDSSAFSTCHIIRAENAGTEAPVFQVGTQASSGTSVSTPGITPPDENALEVRFACGVGSGSNFSFTAPAGLTERTDTTLGGYPGGSTATRTLNSSSATSALNFTASATISGRVGITLGIPTGAPAQQAEPDGIASQEAFGTARLNMQVRPSGIVSAETFGSPKLNFIIFPSGVASGEQFGLPVLVYDQFVYPDGIDTGEEFGTVLVRFPPQTVIPAGVASLEAFGLPDARNTHTQVLNPPRVQETPAGEDWLTARFGIHRGVTLIKRQDGTIYATRYPAQTELEDAERFWMGGHRHPLSAADAADLIDAGFGAYITLEVIDV